MDILWILFAHYVLDFPLQSPYLLQTKATKFYSLFAHSMIYGLGMALCLHFLGSSSIWKAILLVVSHMLIDYLKATAKNEEKKEKEYLYIDQVAHLSINLILYII